MAKGPDNSVEKAQLPVPLGYMKSQTTGQIYEVTFEGLDKMLRDNHKWRKEHGPPKIPFMLS